MIIHKVDSNTWKEVSAQTHRVCFGEEPPTTDERVDFALVAQDPSKDQYVTYVTCRELDRKTLYWQYGAAFPEYRDTLLPWRGYQYMTKKTWDLGYDAIFTLIENTNRGMLKFALKMGYKIIGVRHMNGCTMLEHLLEKAENRR